MLVDDRIHLIGDPHFGKDFRNGTPLHRRGEREKMQRDQFILELNTPNVEMIVMVGDLFDKPFVPLPVLSQVIGDVVDVAQARRGVKFVFMAGNHDKSRQLDVRGAWDIFRLAVGWLPNVVVVDDFASDGDVVFFAWRWDSSAELQVMDLVDDKTFTHINHVIGHWDMKDFGGDTSHMVPVTALLQGFGPNVSIYSGHYHEEKDYQVEGINIHCTGSMQPYAHGEGDMYVTLTVEEALARDDLENLCVRILLEPGEVMPEIDCLQLTRKAVDGELEEVELEAVGATTFNLAGCLDEELDRAEVPIDVRVFIKEKIGAAD
jgi:predicted phosphodiesterase